MENLHAEINSKNYIDAEINNTYIEEIIASRTSHITLKKHPSLNERIDSDISYLLSEINSLKAKISKLENN